MSCLPPPPPLDQSGVDVEDISDGWMLVYVPSAAPAAVTHELVPQLQLPSGFRFVPTEEELVNVYLRAKIEGRKLPLGVVNDVSILDWQPGALVEAYKGYGEKRWFFFAAREQSSSNKDTEPCRKVRVPGVTATWMATGSVQLIRARSKNKEKVVVGTKRVLIYSSSDPDEDGKWSMHEYILQGHDAIGQYALYSIQRKQHLIQSEQRSDTEDNDDMYSTKKRNTGKKKKKPCTELEGVELPHSETTATRKKTKKRNTKRKEKPCTEPEGVQVQLPHPETTTPLAEPLSKSTRNCSPIAHKEDELARQQEARQQPAAAPVILSTVPPLQAELGETTLGASAPTLEEDTIDNYVRELLALLNNNKPTTTMFYNNQGQEQWPWSPSLTGGTTFPAAPNTHAIVDHAALQPYQQEEDRRSLLAVQNLNHHHLSMGVDPSVYMWQGQYAGTFLPDNTIMHPMAMNSGGWEHGDGQRLHQIHRHQREVHGVNNGWGSGSVQVQPMNHHLGGHELPPLDGQSSGSGALVNNANSLQFSESVQMDELTMFVRGMLAGAP